MLPVFLAVTVVAQASTAKVAFQDGAFLVSGALGSEIVPIQAPPAKDDPVDRRKGMFRMTVAGKTVTFDSKGLTVTQKRAVTSRLKSVPTSGKIATKESNNELMRLVAEGKRSLEVSSLSGWELVGDNLFLLLRWDNSQRKPWLEVLMSMDMSQPKPEARLVGKFACLSFAQGVVDDVLVQKGADFMVVGNGPDGLVLSRLAKDGARHDDRLGPIVSKAKFLPDLTTAWVLTSTPYGTNVVGYFESARPVLRTVSEFRGKMRGILPPAFAQFESPDGLRMVNMVSGAVTPVPKDSGQRPTANGLLVWSPKDRPTRATLYDASFRVLANWTGNASAPVSPSGGTKAKPPAVKSATKPSVPPTRVTKRAVPAKSNSAKAPKPKSAAKKPQPSKPNATKPKPGKPKIEVSSKPSGRGRG